MYTNNKSVFTNGKTLVESTCLSTDTKPTDGIANGSVLLEMDTGDVYMFDETGGAWIKFGSGGGGGGDAEVWFTGDTGTPTQGMMMFSLEGEADHIVELANNSENYTIYANGVELPYFTSEGDQRVWSEAEQGSANIAFMVLGVEMAVIYYIDASTAPDSVEVSVKAK